MQAMKSRQKFINIQTVTTINHLTCDHESNRPMQFMKNELCRKSINNHIRQANMQSQDRLSNMIYAI